MSGQDQLQTWALETHKTVAILKSDYEAMTLKISSLEDKLSNLNQLYESSKVLHEEKEKLLLFKLDVMNDKIIASDQKVNDLNLIMMKHFAYKNQFDPFSFPNNKPPTMPSLGTSPNPYDPFSISDKKPSNIPASITSPTLPSPIIKQFDQPGFTFGGKN